MGPGEAAGGPMGPGEAAGAPWGGPWGENAKNVARASARATFFAPAAPNLGPQGPLGRIFVEIYRRY